MLNSSNDNEVLYAGFLVRLWAYIIDWIIVGCAVLIIRIPMFFLSIVFPDLFLFKNILFKFNIVDIVIYLITVSYFIAMTYYYGATLGKKAMKIKVLKENKPKLSILDIIYRETIGRYLSELILCIGYILVAIDSKKRGLHDILCDTIVVYDFSQNKKQQKCINDKVNENNNINESIINENNENNDINENRTDKDI